jgi:hypothetical protein
MRNFAILSFGLTLVGCSGSSTGEGTSGSNDASTTTDVMVDAPSRKDVSAPDDAGKKEAGDRDSGRDDASSDAPDREDGGTPADSESETSILDSGEDGDAEAGPSEASCPATWTAEPSVNALIAVPSEGGIVLLHAAGVGTQNYMCTMGLDGGPAAWTLLGPMAELKDCDDAGIGHHFPSEGGSAYPEWQTNDGTYVIGHKLDPFTPDGGTDSVPWLLLQAVDAGGTGTLRQVAYIQRLDTDGGDPPAMECEAGATVQIPYAADYYFYGP